MKYSFLLLALFVMAFLVAACVVSDTSITTPGPNNSAASQKSRADYAMQQAQQQEGNANAAAILETAQAQNAANFPSTASALFAQQTAQAIEAQATVDARAMLLAQQQAQTTATAEAMSAQQTAQAIEAQATVDARAMLLAQQQAQTTATSEAMQREGVTAEQVASSAQRQREWMSWFIPIVVTIAFGLVLLIGAKFISGMIETANERRTREYQRPALPGTFFKSPTQTIIDVEAQPVSIVPSNGDRMLADRAEVREEVARFKLAMRLLRDAINHVGAQSNRIPPAAQLGWSAGAWNIAVAILRPFGVEILQGTDGGTYLVGQFPTLQALYIAIGEKRLTLYSIPY